MSGPGTPRDASAPRGHEHAGKTVLELVRASGHQKNVVVVSTFLPTHDYAGSARGRPALKPPVVNGLGLAPPPACVGRRASGALSGWQSLPASPLTVPGERIVVLLRNVGVDGALNTVRRRRRDA